MSRAKSRQSADVCGDCGSLDPSWASVNRGMFLCNECCLTHRSLGRNISYVKSFQKSVWPPNLLTMVQALIAGGVNSIWEYALENSKLGKRKPSPTDSVEAKAAFIISKHKNCEFLYRPVTEDGDAECVENELGKQLHASVRSKNLITSYRLLIQGADPNYFHDEKGSTPLHEAVKANQLLQMELLIVYGADPTNPDSKGKSPIMYAGLSQHAVYERLIDCQFEVTDKFSNYLYNKKPDHSSGQHILISSNGSMSSANSMEKLQRLSNILFEELVKDVYDEVERREIEAIWLGSAETIALNAIPFLPVDPSLSSTRNQSRQKLGRFATPELEALVYDLLVDYKRRQGLTENGRLSSQTLEDDHIYDYVASDDDYAVPTTPGEKVKPEPADQNQNVVYESNKSTDRHQVEVLMQQVAESNNTIVELKNEVANLKTLVQHLSSLNYDLRLQIEINGNNRSFVNGNSGPQSLDPSLVNRSTDNSITSQSTTLTNGDLNGENNNLESPELRSRRIPPRPTSMYETRDLRTMNWKTAGMKKNQQQHPNQKPSDQIAKSAIQSQNVMQCTSLVTKGISDLWKCIQGSGRENCVPCADNIRFAVTNLAKAAQVETGSDTVKSLLDSVNQLQTCCIGLQLACKNNDTTLSEEYIQKVRNWAYEIARDTKVVVTKYNNAH